MMIELSGCAIIENEKLLLLHRIDHNHYEFPGGKMEDNESREEAAVREVREELGCNVEIISYFGYYDFEHDARKFRSHKYLGKLRDEPRINEPEKFDEIIWMRIKDYEEYNVAPNVKGFCSEYLKK